MALQRVCRQLSISLTNRLVASSTSSRAASTLLTNSHLFSLQKSTFHNTHQPIKSTSLLSNQATSTMSTSTKNTEALPEGYEKITEGTITMHYPQIANSVFYNPVQVQNRDLSILMIGMYAERRVQRMWTTRKRKEVRRRLMSEQQQGVVVEGESKAERKVRLAKLEEEIEKEVEAAKKDVNFTTLAQESAKNDDGMVIFEALAASGLRSLRYWKEVPGLRTMVVNDLDPGAIDLARENVRRNGLEDALAKEEDDTTTQEESNNEEGNKDPLKRYNLRPPGIQLQVGDATHEMYMSRIPPTLHPSQYNTTQSKYQMTQYDVIDLDPYGSAAPFLDGALQSIVSGGLMCITCTDMAALGGSHPETCYGRYGAFPVQRSGYLQELALRILLYHVSVIAGRYGRTIRPVLSVGMAFYCRVFVEVWDDKAGVNNLSLSHGHLFQSTKCSSFHVTPVATNESVSAKLKGDTDNDGQPKKKLSNVYRNGRGPCELGEPVCGETGGSYKLGGPIWTGPLHDLEVVNDAIDRLEKAEENNRINPTGGTPLHPLKMAKTLHGLLVSVSEELPDVPLYHSLSALCSTVNSSTIPRKSFNAALVNAGYRVSAYHKDPGAVKTDAPNHVVWDVIRGWCKENPPKPKKVNKRHRKGEDPGSNAPPKHPHADVASLILDKEIKTKIDFTIPKSVATRKKAVRYALNPEANWGPKKAASGLGNPNGKRKADDEIDDGPAQKK